jgi:hypothetical protein
MTQGAGAGLRRDDDRRLKGLVVADQIVLRLRPKTGAENCLAGIHVVLDGRAVNGLEIVSFPNPGPGARTALFHDPGLDSVTRVNPGDSVTGDDVPALLMEIDDSENHQPHAQQRE